MNGDTIILNTAFSDAHRSKRIKMGKLRVGNTTLSSMPSSDRRSGVRASLEALTRHVDTIDVRQASVFTSRAIDLDAPTAPAAKLPGIESSSSASIQTEVCSTSPRVEPSKIKQLQTNPEQDLVTPEIDFSSIPSNPIELAWWVAQQVTHFQQDQMEPQELEMEDDHVKSQTHPPGIRTRHSDAHLPPQQIAEREKLRKDNRARKKRWREINTERNKDSDLRCRINKRAKAKFGIDASAEKTLYIEREFNKRRDKRESKQRARAFETGEFPSFAVSAELQNSLFSDQASSASNEVQAAGNLLVSTLCGVGRNNNLRANAEASTALKAALDNSKSTSRPFVEALKIMAMNSDLMKGINEKLDHNKDEMEIMTEDETSIHTRRGVVRRSISAAPIAPTSSTPPTLPSVPVRSPQLNEKLRAIKAATTLLIDMADTKAYDSPYAPYVPSPLSTVNTVSTGDDKTGKGPKKAVPGSMGGHPLNLDNSQIDSFLALANGGSLSDDDDDRTISDPDELLNEPIEFSKLQKDADVAATVGSVVNQLLVARSGGQNPHDLRETHVTNSLADKKSLQGIRDQAGQLQDLFTDASISVNTIVPTAQSQATSQFYSHLSSRARKTMPPIPATPPRVIQPIGTPSTASGSPAQMQPRGLPKPGIFGPNKYIANHNAQQAQAQQGQTAYPPNQGQPTYLVRPGYQAPGYQALQDPRNHPTQQTPPHANLGYQPQPLQHPNQFQSPYQPQPILPAPTMLPSQPIGGRMPPTPRSSRAEELKKVTSYGFPPLPRPKDGPA